MENKVVWHYKSANEEELEKGLNELEEEIVRDAFIESLSKIANNDKNIFNH